MTFEGLQRANETIKLTYIKGKQYAEVNQRIKAFRMLFPMGAIVTECTFPSQDLCVCKATITDENGSIIGTGTAFEERHSSYINETSFVENCETSAVGRALGMCGIGIDTAISSAEELENALNAQEQIKAENAPVDDVHLTALVEQAKADGVDMKKVYAKYGVKTKKDMVMKVYMKIKNEWNDILKECKCGE